MADRLVDFRICLPAGLHRGLGGDLFAYAVDGFFGELGEKGAGEEAMTTKALAAPETALDVAENLAEDRSPEKTQEMLGEVAAVLREAATQQLDTSSSEAIAPAIDFFSAVGRHQLAEGNLVSGYSGGIKSWAAGPMTSSFS